MTTFESHDPATPTVDGAAQRAQARQVGPAASRDLSTGRVESVDALRGLTILTMIFVNDVGSAAPAWAHHIQPPNADGMTVADMVFPGFLFIVGMSIPLAFDRAKQRGVSRLLQVGHILMRTAALLLMGVILNNSPSETTLGPWWGLLACTSILLAWSVVPRDAGLTRNVLWALKVLGIVGLIVLLASYRREPVSTTIAFYGDVPQWVWLRSEWWGILGLIGWAYLTVSLLYLMLGTRREWLMGALAVLVGVFLADRAGGFFTHLDGKSWLDGVRPFIAGAEGVVGSFGRYVGYGSAMGSLASITMAGCLLGTILLPRTGLAHHADRIRWALLFAVGLFTAGLVTDTFGGINKIAATPTWCLWCAAINTVVWIGLYAIMDIGGWRTWSIVVRPAGANPLIAYLLHPILIWSLSLSGVAGMLLSYKSSESPWICMLGSLVMSLAVCGITGLIAQFGLRLRI